MILAIRERGQFALRPLAAVAVEASVSPMSKISIAPNPTLEATAKVDFGPPYDYFGPPPLIPGEQGVIDSSFPLLSSVDLCKFASSFLERFRRSLQKY